MILTLLNQKLRYAQLATKHKKVRIIKSINDLKEFLSFNTFAWVITKIIHFLSL